MKARDTNASSLVAKPLTKCVLRCDPFLRRLSGGLYGYTRGGGKKFHGGVDLYAEPGTETFALGPGIVEWIQVDKKWDWGKCVLTKVELPHMTCWALYAHLSEVFVKAGSPLRRRTLIGLTGITGNGDSKYPHLHLETWSSTKAGLRGTKEKYRFDPLDLLGFLPYQGFALEVLERQNRA
jgi:murein DD-endopeptidase MepM/ murein hydrolase activator NlpD